MKSGAKLVTEDPQTEIEKEIEKEEDHLEKDPVLALDSERVLHALLSTYEMVLDRQTRLLLAQSELRRYLRIYYGQKSGEEKAGSK